MKLQLIQEQLSPGLDYLAQLGVSTRDISIESIWLRDVVSKTVQWVLAVWEQLNNRAADSASTSRTSHF